jgi:hypothetical protein
MWLSAVVVLTLLAVALGAGVFWLGNAIQLGEDTDSPTPAQIQATGRFTIPKSAHDIQAHLEEFQDDALWVRFCMDPADEPDLWRSSLCAGATPVLLGPISMRGIDRAWWTPGSAKAFEFREGEKPGAWQAVLIDRTNPAEFMVYVEVLEY